MDEEAYKGDKEWLARVRGNPLFAQTYIEDIARARVNIWNWNSAYRKLWHRLFNTFLLVAYFVVLFVVVEPAFTFEICVWLRHEPFSISETIHPLNFVLNIYLSFFRLFLSPAWNVSISLAHLCEVGPYVFVFNLCDWKTLASCVLNGTGSVLECVCG